MSVDAHKLKQLQSRRNAAEAEVAARKGDLKAAKAALQVAESRLSSIRDQITKLEQSSVEPIVTEHALLRYIQHAMGIDLEQVKQSILTEQLVTQIKTLGSGRYPLPSAPGFKAQVNGNSIVTVIPS